MKNFFNLSKVPKTTGQNTKSKKIAKTFRVSGFSTLPKFLCNSDLFSQLYNLPRQPKIQNRPLRNLFKYQDLLSSQFLSRNEMVFNLHSLGSIKILKL